MADEWDSMKQPAQEEEWLIILERVEKLTFHTLGLSHSTLSQNNQEKPL